MQQKKWQEQDKNQLWDAVVIGGGMVGSAVALGLSQKGFKVVLVERNPPEIEWHPQQPFQTRVSALTRASENILKQLGVWQGIESRRAYPFTDMHIWESLSNAQVHFASKDVGEDNLGYVIENNVIQSALWEQFAFHPNLSVLQTSDEMQIEYGAVESKIQFGKKTVLRTKLVIGADGAFSKVRELANIDITEHAYEQCAVVGCVKTELPHQQTCWQRYQADGPFAFLAMDEQISSIAWYLPIEKMTWALSLKDDDYAIEIMQASDHRLGKVVEVMERGAFPLVRRHAQHYVKPGVVLVGDAAHTIHPQAGQGVNLGLLDAAALIEVLVDAKQIDSEHWSRLKVLRRYERWRRGDNAIVQRSMEGFDWLFKQESDWKNQFRQWVLPVADEMAPAKNWLMKQALNGRMHLPALAKDSI